MVEMATVLELEVLVALLTGRVAEGRPRLTTRRRVVAPDAKSGHGRLEATRLAPAVSASQAKADPTARGVRVDAALLVAEVSATALRGRFHAGRVRIRDPEPVALGPAA